MKRDQTRLFAMGLKVGALFGALLGEAVALILLVYLHWFRLWDCILLNLLIVAFYCFLGALIGLVVGNLVLRFKDVVLIRPHSEMNFVVAFWVFVVLNLNILVFSDYRVFNLPYIDNSFADTFWKMLLWNIGKALLIFALTGIVCAIVYHLVPAQRRSSRIRRKSRRKKFIWQWWIPPILFPGLLVAVWFRNNLPEAQTAFSPPRLTVMGETNKVMLVGWDGIGWNTLRPLLEENRLPHLGSLMERGYVATLETPEPSMPPMAWARILTGTPTARNHVYGPVAYKIPLVRTPFIPPPFRTGLGLLFKGLSQIHFVKVRSTNALDRFEPTLWELASEAGLNVGVMDGYTTFPAREIEGYLVSRHTYPRLLRAEVEQEPEYIEKGVYDTYPPSLIRQLRDDFEHARDIPPELAQQVVDLQTSDIKELRKIVAEPSDSNLKRILGSLSWDRFRMDGGRNLWHEQGPVFSMYYFDGTRRVMPALWPYRNPKLYLPSSKTKIDRFEDTLDEYLIWMDTQLGSLIADASDEVNIAVVSAQGYGPTFLPFPLLFGSYPVAEDGILVLAGPDITAGTGEGATEVSALDIAPTLLYLLGLPLAENLPGTIIDEAINPSLMKAYPPETVLRYSAPPSIQMVGEKPLGVLIDE